MKLQSLFLRTSLLVFLTLLSLGAPHVAAQSNVQPANQSPLVQTSAVPARITQAIDETQLVRLKGNVHPLARPEFDQGAAPDSTPMNRMLMVLQRSPEQQAALQKLMDEQLSKDSPNYHKWLTPGQLGAQFGPADADIQAVTDWLTQHGFQGIKVAAGRTVIEFSGNVAQVRNAFHTEIHRFLVNGEMRQANSVDPQIPAAVTPVVAGIVSLHNFPKKSMKRDAGTFMKTKDGVVNPLFTTSSGDFIVGPADFAKIYSVPNGLNGAPAVLDGTGVTIGIVADSNISATDVSDFRSLFGLSSNFTSANIVLNGPDPGLNGDEGEADLDVQVSGMVAPAATIKLVVSEGTLTAEGPDLSALYIVDNNIADVMSESFGGCEAFLGTVSNQFQNALWEQAAAQGITVMVAAGDNGSAGCDDFTIQSTAKRGLAVSGTASTPFNVAVGGTDFDDAGKQTSFWNPSTGNAAGTRESALGYIPEIPWNDSCAATATAGNLSPCATATATSPADPCPLCIVAASGGPSSIYAKPSWQMGGITPNDSHRDLPDVSLFASNGFNKSFYLVCEADFPFPPGSPASCVPGPNGFVFLGVGGTSASSPAFAAIMALINQQQKTITPQLGGRQGNANPVLYKIALTPANSCNSSTQPLSPPATCIFYDVTKGNNSVACTGGTLNCSSNSAATNGVLVSGSTPAFTTAAVYDMATGLGSVNVTNLAAKWSAAVGTFKATTTTTTVNGTKTPAPIPHGTPVTLSATVTSALGTPTGDVSFIAPTTVNGGLGPATLSGGTATLTSPSSVAFPLPGGSYTLKAHYAGDGNFAPSDDSTGVPVTVNKENSGVQIGIVTFDSTGHILSTNATNFAYGSPYILRMDILNSTGTSANCQPLANVTNPPVSGCALDATGTVTVTDNGSALTCSPLVPGCTSPFPVNSEGSAEDQPIQLPPGTHNLSATYSGDISYNPSSSPATASITVTKATTTTMVTASPSTITTSTSVTLTATINTLSNGAAPTGTVQFLNGSTPISGTVTYTGQSGAQSATGLATLTATLTTTLAVLPVRPEPRAPVPVIPFLLLSCVSVALALLALRLSRNKRRGYVYATLLLLAGFAAGAVGCGNSSGGSRALAITAQYSGDTNYSASVGSTSVTKQ